MVLATTGRAGTTVYLYNENGRLTGVTTHTGVEYTYSYDAAGNIVSEIVAEGADTDGDGLSDHLEGYIFTDPDDADSDDDGILDGDEDSNHNGDIDDYETDPCLKDTDDDGILDGTELGYDLTDIGPDTDRNIFIPDADPTTTTDPLDRDTDHDGLFDGEEDINFNGMVDTGESDPNRRQFRTLPFLHLLLSDR